MTSNETSTGHAGDSPKAHYGKLEDPRLSAEQMDERRKQNVAYEYLCHLEETKVWLEACLVETLPQTIDLEEGLRNGVFLGKLAHFMTPDLVPIKKIYDRDQTRFKARGLHFRHTDNINHWLRAMERMGLPKIFAPETTDIYDRKNMPRTIYCIHALSLYLFKLGKAPQIQDLYGKVNFTDEEISAMRMELEKYGIQMPAFSKIGGILANEMPVDEAALHAAVIAINDSVDHQQAEITLVALQNPAAHLGNIYVDLSETYQDILFEAKTMKTDIARNKSLDPGSSYIPDAYDELLTQAEIQGNINKVNVVYALGCLHDAVENRDEKGMVKSLLRPQLMIRDVRKSVAPLYLSELLQAIDNKMHNNNEEDRMLNKDEVQAAIYSANVKADKQGQKSEVVKLINSAIEEREQQVLLGALQMPEAQLPAIQPAAAPLYFNELVNMKEEKQAPLDYDEITGGLEVLTAVAFVNETVKSGNPNMTYQALSQEEAHVHSLDDDCKSRYQQALVDAKFKKEKDNSGLLTHSEVQHCVDEVNNQVLEENDRITAVEKINEAVDAGDAEQTIIMLKLPAAQLDMVADAHATQYQVILTQAKSGKAEETKDPTASLWYEEIKNAVNFVNKQAADGKELSLGVIAINIAVDAAEENALLKCLQNEDVGLHSLTQQCKTAYLNKLSAFKTKKTEAGNSGSGWIMNRLREGHKFYFNYITMEYAFDRPSNIKKDHSLLSKEEIQSCINEVTSSYDRQLLYKANQRFIVQLQAYARGYLVRKRFTQRRCYLSSTAPSVVKLQSWWRMIQEKRNYQDRLGHLHSQEKQTLQIQAAVRMYLVRKKYLERMKFLKEKEPVVVKLQSFMRANWAKKDYQTLMHGNNPPLSVVRRFVHLLDIGDLDYTEEIELERLREQLVSEIRSNQHLEGDLNQMDIKIGLLVRNRITLQDVISQHKTLKQYRDKDNETFSKGLKALSKQSRARLEGYQHLFYMLQTNPTYLAKLIFEMPQSRTTKFMESVILTIYNYASNQREEYLLLKLFKTALQEEIRSKVDKMSDIVTGNPMVVKMIVSYNRNTRGQNSLRDLLYPLVRSVIDDHSLLINTNPAEVYKHWVNSTETKTGKVSGLPYDATIEEAMQHEEVQIQIQQSVECLREVTERFLNAILQSIHCIPYGMRYMARVMKEALHEKFPEAPEKDVLKIVGNLIYYRYINSAIVAPDAFDIIDLSANKGLTNDQRRNLGSVAKILQFAASNKGFGGDSAHLSSLNPYIMEAHNKFKKYFRAVCEVEEPEVMFNMDQYTDLVRITKPIIYISIAEIMDTHKSLLEHLEAIASDPEDQIYELIDDLGDVPDVESLLGESGIEDNPANKAQLSKTEISLTLSSKFEVADDEESDTKSLFIRTKRMVVDLIRCQRTGENLIHVLNIPSSEAEEQDHEVLVKRREIMDNKASRKTKLVRQPSLLAETRLPLEGIKEHVRTHLAQLEKLGVVTKQDSYQYLINSIVQDMRNQRLYRQRRKQEVVRLRQTLRSLAAKRSFFEEQVDYYNQYVKTCLDNLSTKAKKSGKKFSLFSRDGKYKAKGSVKYSAARLHEKGVILEIEGLPTNQFKNVLFEITATETQGLFDVSAKLMGVNMEKVELVFQDLLQLQYEGVAVMKMFDKAKINVNLLIFLLNKKFYGK